MTLAILVYATLIRAVLVPTFMKLTVCANWCCRRVQPVRHFGVWFGCMIRNKKGHPSDAPFTTKIQ